MTPREFIIGKFGTVAWDSSEMEGFSRQELTELIEEYDQIQNHIQKGHVTLDDTPIDAKKWIEYNEDYQRWREKYSDDLTSFEAGMSKPNKPNYYRANND